MVALNLSNILAANNTTFLSSSNYTATAGQVKFAADYTVGYVEVYQNGLRLADSDFTAANGEHVLLNSAASVSDNIDIIAHQAANLTVLGAALPTTNMIAGTGLTGGGTLAADRTFNVDTSTLVANTFLQPIVANTNSYIGAVSTREAAHYAVLVANTSTKAQLANTNSFTVRTTGGNQTMSPSLTISNTIIVQHGVPVRTAGGNNVTLALGDNGKLIYCVNSGRAMNIHIPNNSSVAFPVGAEMSFLQHLTHASANTLGFSNAAGVSLHSKEAANTVADRFTTAVLKKLATNTWVLAGSLS